VNEKILVQQARRGDQQALAQLLQENYRMVLGYFIKITLDKPAAEDLVQETMIRAIEKLKLYDERFKFSTWLIAIGTNIYRDKLRRRGAVSEFDLDMIPDFRGDGDLELKTDLRAALKGLAVEKRITIVLRYFYEYSYEEIAGILKVPAGTVRSRLHNGIEELQRALAEE
jgi:RNA polymerase sigma-70 factor (ECF subfamily)